MLELSVASHFDFGSQEYCELFACADVTAFQHPLWQTAMQAYVSQFAELEERTLVMRCSKSGFLVGIIPLLARKKLSATVLEYANLGLVDYALPILHKDIMNWIPDARIVSEKLVATLGTYDVLRIKHMPQGNPAMLKLFPGSYMQRADFSAYATELGPDYEAWRCEAISKSERKHRDKKRRAMMRNGDWQMHRLYEPDDIRIALDYLRAFHKDRYAERPGEDHIQDPAAFEFYLDLALKNTKNGFVRVYRFTYGDEIVAVQYGIEHAGHYLYLMMGVDFDRMGRYSPGLLMTEDIIADCVKDGIRVFDLTVGDEPYKLKFGTRSIPIYTLWHTHSVLGNVGLTFADLVNRSPMSSRLRRWVS